MTDRRDDDPWEPRLYDSKHSYVWKLAASVIELLAPQAGERILDVGCGTGQLTSQVAESGAVVTGIDNSVSMIEEARRSFPSIRFELADAHDFSFEKPFDAVFSNAALHWIQEPLKVVRCMSESLKVNGRMAVEFGGHGNVRMVIQALQTATKEFLGEQFANPFYFPIIAGFGSVLEQHGLEIIQAAMIDRPTPLEGQDGLQNWVRMFGQAWLARIPAEQHDSFLERVEAIARPALFRDSTWIADYRRIRVQAHKIESSPF